MPPGVRAEERLDAEVVVVGGGPAGLAAAVHAAEAGARTLLVDTYPRPGGQIWRHRGDPPAAARDWIARFARAGVTPLVGATVVDAAAQELLLDHAGRPRRVRFDRLVLATGARELFLPFPGWTLPGVVGVGGAQAMLKAGARFSGKRVVVAGSGPLLPAVAAALAKDGARDRGLCRAGAARDGSRLRRRALALAAEDRRGPRLRRAPRGRAATARGPGCARSRSSGGALRATLTDGRRTWTWDCDVLACGYGLVPNLELPRLLGCETDGGSRGARRRAADERSRDLRGRRARGRRGRRPRAGHRRDRRPRGGRAPIPAGLVRRRDRELAFGARLARAFALRDELRGLARPDTPVCRCEDVAHGRFEGLASAREAKLATRAGMGPCQGRVCGPALGFLRGWPEGSIRPPLFPTPLAALAQGNDEARDRT